MKKYIKPDLNAKLFEVEDVITSSTAEDVLGRSLKRMVNGNTGTDYGSQEMTIFD